MFFDLSLQTEVFLQLVLALILGAFVGLEREYRRKEAGLRTYSLVCLGAAFFTIIGIVSLQMFSGAGASFDPSRIVGQIVLGVGFLGAGLIIFRQDHVEGLTTAAGLWVTAAIGTAIGLKLYLLAFFAAALAVAVLAGMKLIEDRLFGKRTGDS